MDLSKLANQIRQDIIKMLVTAGSGHSAGPLGVTDVLVALYFGGELSLRPKQPDWPDRDRVVLSAGHLAPALYAVMAHRGYFPVSELMTLRKYGTRLEGHPHNLALPGLETSSGPLGQGISQALGMALAGKMDQKTWRVWCLMGDGEQDEGQVWEAAMLAGKEKLDNLVAIIDRNNIQIDGYTEEVMPLEPLKTRYESFGWHILEADGHNIEALNESFAEAKAIHEKPIGIIAHTIPGKGVDFMENKFEWHGIPPKPAEAKIALHELRTLKGRIRSEHE